VNGSPGAELPALRWMPRDVSDVDDVLGHEWLLTNALGGYASPAATRGGTTASSCR